MLIKVIFLSVVFHIALVYLLFQKKKKPEPQAPFITWHEPLSVRESPTPKSSGANQGTGSGQKKGRSRKAIDIQVQDVLRNPVTSGAAVSAENTVLSFSDGAFTDLQEGFGAANELPRPIEAIWRQIRSGIHYHSDFYIDNIQGDVKAEVLIGQSGKLEALTSIYGQDSLVEWIKTALSQTLNQNFLPHKMKQKLLLRLNFHFRILPHPAPVQEFVYSNLNLNFNIFGYKDFETGAASDVYNHFKNKKMHRISEWNFTKRLEPFRDSCFIRKNPIGCEKTIQYLTAAGLHLEANEAKLFLKQLPASN